MHQPPRSFPLSQCFQPGRHFDLEPKAAPSRKRHLLPCPIETLTNIAALTEAGTMLHSFPARKMSDEHLTIKAHCQNRSCLASRSSTPSAKKGRTVKTDSGCRRGVTAAFGFRSSTRLALCLLLPRAIRILGSSTQHAIV
eukprot:TRINITY_DN20270_c0_g1_i1.p2 TRINITY_DN20270_c0_g1~~TRINITY_DN20270_c0_g1_i1.p2  ORF type:complete len:140 (-),score=6.44 TRINITY_DN20270_c0_g1_i1:111-530(-)